MNPAVTLSTRSVIRDYKKVFRDVRKKQQPVVITYRNEPQLALVSLEDYEQLRLVHNTPKTLKNIVAAVQKTIPKNSKIPSDLSSRLDYYAWETE